MAETGTLHEAFLDELRDLYHAEKQLLKALPKMAEASTSRDLAEAFTLHLRQTEGHVRRLEQVFAELEQEPKAKTCEGMKGIIDEASEMMDGSFDNETRDAVLIASAQRAEHYEIAAYGTLVTWARTMSHAGAADLLQETLKEEKATDDKLTSLAEQGINRTAARPSA